MRCKFDKQSFKFRFVAQFDLPLRRGAHCASDNHQELVVVKNISIFGEISSFSVVFVFMPFRHEPDARPYEWCGKSEFEDSLMHKRGAASYDVCHKRQPLVLGHRGEGDAKERLCPLGELG